jgi:hypothetical protein
LPSSILSVDSAQKTIFPNPTKKTRLVGFITAYFDRRAGFPQRLQTNPRSGAVRRAGIARNRLQERFDSGRRGRRCDRRLTVTQLSRGGNCVMRQR